MRKQSGLDISGDAGRLGNSATLGLQSFDMEADCLAEFLPDLRNESG